MRSFTWTSARPQLSLFVALAARLWWFPAGCHIKSLSSPHPSQTEVCSTMRESIRPSSFHNPTLSANKHVVQICRFSLSAAVDGLADHAVQVSVETSPFNGDAQSGNDIERSLRRAVVPQSLAVSAIMFPTALSLYIAQRRFKCERSPLCKLFSKIEPLPFEKNININLVGSSCLKHATG